MIIYHKTRHVLTRWASNCTLEYLSQSNGNLCLHKNLYTMFIAALFVADGRVETAQKPFSGWIIKQTVVYPYHGMLLWNKKQRAIDTQSNLYGFQENYAEWKKANPIHTVWFHVYNILEMTNW